MVLVIHLMPEAADYTGSQLMLCVCGLAMGCISRLVVGFLQDFRKWGEGDREEMKS